MHNLYIYIPPPLRFSLNIFLNTYFGPWIIKKLYCGPPEYPCLQSYGSRRQTGSRSSHLSDIWSLWWDLWQSATLTSVSSSYYDCVSGIMAVGRIWLLLKGSFHCARAKNVFLCLVGPWSIPVLKMASTILLPVYMSIVYIEILLAIAII